MHSEFAPLLQLAKAERLQLITDLWVSIAQEEAPLPVSDLKRDGLHQGKEHFLEHSASTSEPAKHSVSVVVQLFQYLADERGDRTAVVLPLSDYEKLLEDLDDLAVVAERRDEPMIAHEDFLADLRRDGML